MMDAQPLAHGWILKAERRFKKFWLIAHVLLVGIFLVSLIERNGFFLGHLSWTWGSSLVCLSVIQARWFKIRVMANPQNQTIPMTDGGEAKGKRDKFGFSVWWKFAESMMNYYWILGFVCIAISRWTDW